MCGVRTFSDEVTRVLMHVIGILLRGGQWGTDRIPNLGHLIHVRHPSLTVWRLHVQDPGARRLSAEGLLPGPWVPSSHCVLSWQEGQGAL